MNFYETDPEFMERFEHFTFEEVINEEGQQLPEITRYMAIYRISARLNAVACINKAAE